MMHLFVYSAVLSVHVILTSGLRILESPPLNCTQEGLPCTADINNCLDQGWLKPRKFTPTGPQNLTVELAVRADEGGALVPVLVVNWAAHIDGSIKFMKGAEVHVLEMFFNLNRCVHYIFTEIPPRKKWLDGAWSFSLDRVVVDPDQKYMVSVNNLPKPNIGHDSYNVFQIITVPGCTDDRIKKTKKCVESGSLWRSNISLETSKELDGKAAITVGFSGTEFSEKYNVAVQCQQGNREYQPINKSNQTSLKATFSLEKWPQTCCSFIVEIQPFFVHCQNDCIRRWKKFDICPSSPTSAPRASFHAPLATGLTVSLAVVLLCVVTCSAYFYRGKLLTDQQVGKIAQKAFPLKDSQDKPSSPRKVLLIYSLDHPLYRDVVLKLCAFLRARCGTEVVLDLLDSAWLGAVGRMQWLDWQKQQIEKSSGKILVLCSRGVRAKWRAMCGEGRVQLREDLRSPMGDMLTPALNLIIPDFVHSSSFQKYIVAYFEDISCEDDVPAPFNITIKYKLMKHFEELYFRILEEEKHGPGRVNRIEGIAQDEYFNCPSGRALRDAIETLQAYQLDNPDWFEKECVGSEEEVAESEIEHPLLADACGNSIIQCVPEFKDGPPILVNEVEFNEDARGVQASIPLVSQGGGGLSTHEFHPGVHPSDSQLCCSGLAVEGDPLVLARSLHLSVSEVQPRWSDAALREPPWPIRNACHFLGVAEESHPAERAEGSLSPALMSRLQALQQSSSLGQDISAIPTADEEQRKRPQSGSDQGYISRSSHPQDSTHRERSEDPLEALSRLQEACLLSSLAPRGGLCSGEEAFGRDQQ